MRWKRPRLLGLARLLFSLCCIVWVVRSEPGLWVSIGAGALAAVVVLESSASLADAVTAGLGLATFVAALDYISWRIKVVSWGHAWISVPLLLAETLGAVHIVGLQYTLWPRKEADRHLGRELDGWPVWVFVPTVDEGPEILEATIRAIQRAADDFRQAHPWIAIRIVICNDGGVAGAPCATSVEELARRLGVVCITRTVGGGAKAGNIEYCRQTVGATGEALLVVFDADQCPEPAFFLETLPLMADPQMGWVQTGQYYRNLDNPVARWANDQQALFYRAICPGKSAQNAAFICGTNVVINAVALDEIGGFPTDSVTEDFAASIRLHVRWHSVFVPGVLATGLGPEDLPSYFKQQRRWARGTFGVLGQHWKELLLPRKKGRGLSGAQRIHYALACTHYLSGLRDVVYVVAPLMFLLTGAAAVHGATLAAFVWHFVPYFVVAQAAFWYATRAKFGLRGVVIGFGSAPVLAGAAIATLGRRRGIFTVTSKRRAAKADVSWLAPHLIVLAVSVVAFPLAAANRPGGAVVVSLAWVGYEIVLLTAFLALGVADLGWTSLRWAKLRAIRLPALTRRWTALGGTFLLAAAAVLTLTPELVAAHADPAVFRPGAAGSPSPGVFLSGTQQADLLRLQSSLHLRFGVVGRTEEILEPFDEAWARQVTKAGARPWIVLQFTNKGVASFWSSLPSIANGTFDVALRNLARQMANFGAPIYLSVLPDVDRNWAASSGVANGGVPQDVSRAWYHIQAIFASEGARNVAWAWDPADPAHDQLYATAPASVEAVVVTLIKYPAQVWKDPAQELAEVAQRHPGKPLMLDVALDGSPARKAAWLVKLRRAVDASREILDVSYHQGGPELYPTSPRARPWLVTSDEATASGFVSLFATTSVAATARRPVVITPSAVAP